MTPRQVGLLAALAFLWGASYLLIKYALEDFTPAFLVFARCAVAAVVLYAIVRWRGGEAHAGVSDLRRRPWHALGLGAVAITIPFLLITVGEQHVPTGLTAVLIAPASIWVAALAPVIDPSESITRAQAVGLAVGLAGVALLVGVETVSSTEEFLGAMGIIGAALAYAISSFVVKGPYGGLPPVTNSFISVAAGAALCLPIALFGLPTATPGARAVLSLLVLSVLGTAIAFVIFYELIAQVGAGRASLVSYLAPPIALFYGVVFLDESIGLAAVGGLGLILVGVWLAARKGAAPAAGEVPPQPSRVPGTLEG